MTDKVFVSKTYNNSYNTIQKVTLMKTWAEELNRHFPQNDRQTGSRHMQKYSTLLTIREK